MGSPMLKMMWEIQNVHYYISKLDHYAVFKRIILRSAPICYYCVRLVSQWNRREIDPEKNVTSV